MEQVAATGQNRCNLIVATHNEASVLKALSKMSSLGISPTDNTVVFGQIYGMAFNISVKLGNDSYCDELDSEITLLILLSEIHMLSPFLTASEGYTVYNSVPYGSLFDVLPYLSRRATENRAVLKGTRRERTLLAKEIRARFLGI